MNNNNPTSPREMLFAAYGRNPPVQALGRLESELSLMRRNFMDDVFLVEKLRDEARNTDTDLDVSGTFNCSLIAWLYGCTDVNPLPPHYRCRNCKTTQFFCGGDGWDLPARTCCGQPMEPDGHGIPVESALTVLKDERCPLMIRIAETFAERAVEIIRDHYKGRFNLIPFRTEIERGRFQFVLIPTSGQLPELDETGTWRTKGEERMTLGYRSIKLLCRDIKERLRVLRSETGPEPSMDDLRAKLVMTLTEARLEEEIRTEGGVLLKSEEVNLTGLLKVAGYLLSVQDEDNPVFRNENATYSDLFSCREEVWNLIKGATNPEYGLSDSLAAGIMEKTRKGRYTDNRMKPETEQLLRGLGIEERWIEQMKHTNWLPTKADLICRLLDELKLSWYELKQENGG